MLRKGLGGGVESGEASSSADTVKLTTLEPVASRFEHYELVTGQDGKPVELGRGAMGIRAKAFSFLNTRSDFLTVEAVAALLATPSAALGDSVSSASVAALPTRGDDVLEDDGGSILCPRATEYFPFRVVTAM
jgi:hypothetical protein